ncbi:unnamed protein product [Fusarium graminearum]|nr:unnamed protein product [Fusarium graminearum]CAF3647678.1 unnamed protein product [Fusarium graminearum]
MSIYSLSIKTIKYSIISMPKMSIFKQYSRAIRSWLSASPNGTIRKAALPPFTFLPQQLQVKCDKAKAAADEADQALHDLLKQTPCPKQPPAVSDAYLRAILQQQKLCNKRQEALQLDLERYQRALYEQALNKEP